MKRNPKQPGANPVMDWEQRFQHKMDTSSVPFCCSSLHAFGKMYGNMKEETRVSTKHHIGVTIRTVKGG